MDFSCTLARKCLLCKTEVASVEAGTSDAAAASVALPPPEARQEQAAGEVHQHDAGCATGRCCRAFRTRV